MHRVAGDIGNICLFGTVIVLIIWFIQYTILAKWYKNVIGVTLVGFAFVDVAIYLPSMFALADPKGFAHFATTNWYFWESFFVVLFSFSFAITRVVSWELIRRGKKHVRLTPRERYKDRVDKV